MRTVLPTELQKMADQVEPYLVKDGFNVYLSKEAPPEIVEMDKKVMEFYNKEQELSDRIGLGEMLTEEEITKLSMGICPWPNMKAARKHKNLDK